MRKVTQFLSTVLFIAALTCCSPVKPIAVYYPTETPAGMGQNEQKEVIMRAGRDEGWKVYQVAPGQIIASYEKFPKRAVVNIYLKKGAYKMTYRDSHDLHYNGSQIDLIYNEWSANLKKRIDEYFTQAAEQ